MLKKRTRLMQAIRAVNAEREYISESGHTWFLEPICDCEGYASDVLWVYSRKSTGRFIRTLLFGPFRFWFVEVGHGVKDAHFMVEFTPTGEVFDNFSRALVDKGNLGKGWDLKYSYFKLKVMLRLIFI